MSVLNLLCIRLDKFTRVVPEQDSLGHSNVLVVLATTEKVLFNHERNNYPSVKKFGFQ